MNKKIILISKDVLIPSYLQPYNQESHTPNINELFKKGTLFNRHYAAAPSTAMSFSAFSTEKYMFELNRADYVEVDEYSEETIFDKFYKLGYACHIIWSKNYTPMAWKFSKSYGKNTVIHDHLKLNQSVGVHSIEQRDELQEDLELCSTTIKSIIDLVKELINTEKIFLWIHLPHVILGGTGYGSDMKCFDKFVGDIRKMFSDDSIYITADHGHMNGVKGKTTYGFDLYESAIRIPLITPKINQTDNVVDYPTSNTQLFDIINGNVRKEMFVYSETAYYAQKHRKLAIIYGNYKYIYSRKGSKEELYDVKYDPNENDNLLEDFIYDIDRKRKVSKKELIYYPNRKEVKNVYIILKQEFDRIWKTGSLKEEQRASCRKFKNTIKSFVKKKFGIKK
jgi:arylsulfatase A-like enzyme